MEADLVVIGAGLNGITFAATYHRLHPTARIWVIEASGSIGGPWASHRIFPGLKTNNLWGMYENPDFPMDEARFGVKKGEFLPAEKVLAYMCAFVEHAGIADYVRLNTRVNVVEKAAEGWVLHCTSINPDSNATAFVIKTSKLIIAVGFTNKPSMPRFPTSAEFKPTVIHSKDFPAHFADITKPGTHTLVIGGGKSAWDIAYACASVPDSTATMLIRPSGNGPVWMSPSHVTPLGLWLEKLVFTRFLGFMSPCPWAETSGFEGWTRRFLHGTWLGRKIVETFWGIISEDVVQLNKLNEHPETKKLRPWRSAFEVGVGLGIMNYPTDFFDLVRSGKIKVLIDEVEKLESGNEVLLKSNGKMDCDAVVCATGWTVGDTLKFKPEGLEKELGLPTRTQQTNQEMDLIKAVEADLYAQFPFLKYRDTSRTHHPDPALRYVQTKDPHQQPYRLYRFMVPPSDFERRSIGFAGALMSLGNAFCAYVQSIWLTAYLDGTLQLPAAQPEKFVYEVYRDSQYCALRNTMGFGNKYPDLVWDSLPYFDAMARDLGFEGKRKGSVFGLTNWAAECWKGYGPEDYRGLVSEWEQRMRRDEEDGKKERMMVHAMI